MINESSWPQAIPRIDHFTIDTTNRAKMIHVTGLDYRTTFNVIEFTFKFRISGLRITTRNLIIESRRNTSDTRIDFGIVAFRTCGIRKQLLWKTCENNKTLRLLGH